MTNEQDRQKAISLVGTVLLELASVGLLKSGKKQLPDSENAIAAVIAAERERADRYRAALRKVPDYTSDGGCTWCGAEERVVYADRVYQEGEPHKSDCPRVLMPEVWEEKA